jgi:F0F1-type ATP synthase delta subunit
MNSKYLAKLIIDNQGNFQKVLEIVKKYKLEKLLPSTLSVIGKIQNREENRNKIKVESVVELDTNSKNEIEKLVNGKIDKLSIDKNLIAGFKVYTREKIVDASLANMLKKLV